jgi:AcrR family transcriptional regulator
MARVRGWVSSLTENGNGERNQGELRQTRPLPIDLAESEILKRGLEAFAELGYSGASVRELTRRMAVNHNFINDRFGSKMNFWRAVVDNAVAGPHEEIMEILESSSGDVEKFESVIRRMYLLSTHEPDMNRIISDISVLDSSRLDYLHSNYNGPFLEALAPLVHRLIKAGKMREISMDVLHSALMGPAIFLSQQQLGRRIRGVADPSPEELESTAFDLADVVIRGLLA